MTRLPAPGSDDNQWGDILNDFLMVEHNADGSQKPLPQSKITNLITDLADKEDKSAKGAANGYAPLDGSSKVPAANLPTAPAFVDASTTTKGLTKLSTAPITASDPIAIAQTDPKVTADQAAGVASIRTLGYGANQAPQGSAVDARLSAVEGSRRTGRGGYVTLRKVALDNTDVHGLIVSDSTSLINTPWTQQWAALLGAAHPEKRVQRHIWNDAGSTYDAAITDQAGTGTANAGGPYTIHLWVMAAGGRNLAYPQGANWTAGVAAIDADFVMLSHGYNESIYMDIFTPAYAALAERIRATKPLTEFIAILQGPTTTDILQQQRANEITRLASRAGWGVIDIMNVFLAHATWATDWLQQPQPNVHPNSTGMAAWAVEVNRFFTPADIGEEPRTSPPSTLLTPTENLLSNGDFVTFTVGTAPTGWTLGGSITFSKDLTNLETKGYGVRMASVVGNNYIRQDVTATVLPLVKGQWVTVLARVYIPSGQGQGAGLIAVDDGVTTILISPTVTQGQGGFKDVSLRYKVATTATRLRVYLYCAGASETSGSDVTYDRVCLSRGLMPRDVSGGPAGPTGATGATGAIGSGSRAELVVIARGILAETVPLLATGQTAAVTFNLTSGTMVAALAGFKAGDIVRGLALLWGATSLTPTLVKIALLSKAGVLLASSPDKSSVATTGGAKEWDFSAPFTILTDDAYYLALLPVFTGGPCSLLIGGRTSYMGTVINGGKPPSMIQAGLSDVPSPAVLAAGNTAWHLAAYGTPA